MIGRMRLGRSGNLFVFGGYTKYGSGMNQLFECCTKVLHQSDYEKSPRQKIGKLKTEVSRKTKQVQIYISY